MEAHACASYRVTDFDVYAYPRPALEQGCIVCEYNLFAMSTRRMGWAVRDGQLSANTLVPVYTANYRLLERKVNKAAEQQQEQKARYIS